MRPSFRLVGVAAALLVLSTTATACNTSPSAATVNSQAIKQTALYSELRAWAASSAYVSAVDSSNDSSSGSSGATLTVAGQTPDTYSTAWVADVLGGMIGATVVHQHLVATGVTPSSGIEAAARSVNEISQVGFEQFSPAFRQTLTIRLADEAAVTTVSVPVATLLSAYTQYKTYFFTQVCVAEVATFNLTQAGDAVAGGLPNGTTLCYDQTQFEQQSAAFQNAVRGLAVGKVATPIKTSYGYQVAKVLSRKVQPFSSDLQRVLSTVIASSNNEPNAVLDRLAASARVQVNPAYGTWRNQQVVPPAPPNLSPTT